ncbi:MAG: hypothetical protein AAGI88_00010 [Pseudomonadota bacterium]
MPSITRPVALPLLVVGLMVLLLPAAHAATVTFEAVCLSPADCAGDTAFRFEVTLDANVVAPNTTYNATADNGANLVGYFLASDAGDGFIGPGAFADISGLNGDLLFPFDASGNLTGILDGDGDNIFLFALSDDSGAFNWVNQDSRITSRQDFLPVEVRVGDDITVAFRRVSPTAVPTYANTLLLALSMFLLGILSLRRGKALAEEAV